MPDRRMACLAVIACTAAACADHGASDERRRALAAACRQERPRAGQPDEVLPIFRAAFPNRQDPLRPMAFDALACRGRWSDVPELEVALRDDTEPVGIRMRAAEALDPRTAGAESALAGVIDDPRLPAPLRIMALRTLGAGCTSAAVTVVRALQQEPHVRSAALVSLAELRDVEALRAATRHADADVREGALAALGSLGARAKDSLPELEAALLVPALRPAALSALQALGHVAVPSLLGALASPDAEVRAQAAHCLGGMRHGAKAAIPALEAVSRGDENERARHAAKGALRDIGPSLAELAERLEMPDKDTRTRAIAGIQLAIKELDLDGGEFVIPLRRRLADPAGEVRSEAIYALRDSRAVDAVPDIIERLRQDEEPYVRRAAAWALGDLHEAVRSPETRALLVAALQRAESDRDSDVRRTASASLGKSREAPSTTAVRCREAR